jgi:glucose-6-phosphate isomerase
LGSFLLGTRRALYENGRESITITVGDVSPFTIGVLIALFERAVGLYASLININSYNQPGVQAGKKAAAELVSLEAAVIEFLSEAGRKGATPARIAEALKAQDEVESVFKLCEWLSANPERGFVKTAGKTPFDASYRKR